MKIRMAVSGAGVMSGPVVSRWKLIRLKALPSIRGLAKDLRISVITTKRAYDELERSGFIYTIPGKGSFVAAKNPELVREEHLKKIEEHMAAIRSLAQGAALTREEMLQMWSLMWEESK